jgi:activator of HSP90 ATPase
MSSIHLEVNIPAPPSWVYQALVDPKRFVALTGAPATGEPTEGGAFSAFGGQVTGRHIELVPNQRVVQAWREATWPRGAYSIARFELTSQLGSLHGETTKLVFDHDGFPPDATDPLVSGWKTRYWDRTLSRLCTASSELVDRGRSAA